MYTHLTIFRLQPAPKDQRYLNIRKGSSKHPFKIQVRAVNPKLPKKDHFKTQNPVFARTGRPYHLPFLQFLVLSCVRHGSTTKKAKLHYYIHSYSSTTPSSLNINNRASLGNRSVRTTTFFTRTRCVGFPGSCKSPVTLCRSCM